MDVSKNRGTSKWMVYNGKPYSNGWFGGKTHYFWKHPYHATAPANRMTSSTRDQIEGADWRCGPHVGIAIATPIAKVWMIILGGGLKHLVKPGKKKIKWLFSCGEYTHKIHGTGIFTYMNGWFLYMFMVNVGKYTIHGCYRTWLMIIQNSVAYFPSWPIDLPIFLSTQIMSHQPARRVVFCQVDSPGVWRMVRMAQV